MVAVLALLVLALPGYVFQRRLRRRTPEITRSAFEETLVILFSGVAVDAVVGVVLVLFWTALGAFPHFSTLVTDPRGYLAQHLAEVVLWAAGALSAAVLVAFLAASPRVGEWGGKFFGKTAEQRKRRDPQKSAWWLLFTEHPGMRVYVGCMLADGGYVAGYLHSFNTSVTESCDRELTLRGEISYRPANAADLVVLPRVNAVSVSAERIQLLTVTYVEQAVAEVSETAPESPDEQVS
ncbi:hypothetical protein [Alloactinosynnema sp. L-07]|nr:hypothetical protein [Alloactinosynnema sp. L-07]